MFCDVDLALGCGERKNLYHFSTNCHLGWVDLLFYLYHYSPRRLFWETCFFVPAVELKYLGLSSPGFSFVLCTNVLWRYGQFSLLNPGQTSGGQNCFPWCYILNKMRKIKRGIKLIVLSLLGKYYTSKVCVNEEEMAISDIRERGVR